MPKANVKLCKKPLLKEGAEGERWNENQKQNAIALTLIALIFINNSLPKQFRLMWVKSISINMYVMCVLYICVYKYVLLLR